LEKLHEAYTGSQEIDGFRSYVSRLLGAWVEYLHGDESVVLSLRRNVRPLRYPHNLTGCGYNENSVSYGLRSDGETHEQRKFALADLRNMNSTEVQQLVEQNPELPIVVSLLPRVDHVFNTGIRPDIFSFDETMQFIVQDTGIITPEEYTSKLDVLQLAQAIEKLADDTHVYTYSLKKRQRKGEICLACQRVDP